jgi:hypothetical protein
MKTKTTFISPDTTQTLTIAVGEGKRGFNVHVSHRIGKTRSTTGCRSNHDTQADADKAVASLKAEAVKNGWTTKNVIVKNAFTSIPVASKDAEPEARAPKAGKKNGKTATK